VLSVIDVVFRRAAAAPRAGLATLHAIALGHAASKTTAAARPLLAFWTLSSH
jgi:hypothetical protein